MTFSEGSEKVTQKLTGDFAKTVLQWATPIMLAAFAYIAPAWLDKRIDDRVAPLERIIAQQEQRLAIIDNTMTRGRQDRESFQLKTEQSLASIQVLQIKMAEAIATLTATLAQMQRNSK